ncbi:hypothetical protein M422DRAFT_249701 [Sphaerobolus stellatus SS14]|uniref:Uncharacterized protein n=1 Tax=Sphaerobolus stellatus (strain SS14) TaxID=990650 RepID=A0A0C9VI30_SPHS4|nr:hypothetical protein M422DRAFT_249701 [Sphaerobolus stellatus SS14]
MTSHCPEFGNDEPELKNASCHQTSPPEILPIMPKFLRLAPFVTGYAFSDEKIGSLFAFDASNQARVDVITTLIIQTVLDEDGYLSLTTAYTIATPKRLVVVIALDDDGDKERLMKKPLPPLHPSLERILDVLDGPDVYETH